MLKIFRRIRQKLLKENRLTRYLAYAFGEIFLVVIGILIALQVNNWNEDRKIKKAEQNLLISLLAEFDTNREILDQTIALNKTIIEKSQDIGKYTGPILGKFDELELSNMMVGAFKYEARIVANQGTIQETINSGKLSILSNPDLRKAIINWQSDLERVKNQENYVVERRDIAHNYFINSGNFRRHLDLIEDSLIDGGPSKFPINDFSFLQNQEFESHLYLFIVASANLNQVFYSSLKERTNTVIALIQSELN